MKAYIELGPTADVDNKAYIVTEHNGEVHKHPIYTHELLYIRDAIEEYLNKFDARPTELGKQFIADFQQATKDFIYYGGAK